MALSAQPAGAQCGGVKHANPMLLTPDSGGGAASDANVVRRAGRRYPGRVVVLDWIAYSAGHRAWFSGDSLHVTPVGAAALARLCSTALGFAVPTREKWGNRKP